MGSTPHLGDDEISDLKESAAYLQAAFLGILRVVQRLEQFRPRRPFQIHRTPPVQPGSAPLPPHSADLRIMPMPRDRAPRLPELKNDHGLAARPSRPVASRKASHQSVIETLIGERGLGGVGLFLLLIGVAFLVSHAYAQGWLSPQTLVIIAVVAGMAVLGSGQFCIFQNKRGIGLGLLAFSAGLLQFAVAWGHDAHALFSHTFALVGYSGIAALTLSLSVYSRSQPTTLMCALAAYAASIGIGLQAERIGLLALYLFGLSAALLLVGIRRNWEIMRYVAWLGAALPLSLWMICHPEPAAAWSRLGLTGLFFLLFQAEMFLALASRGTRSHRSLALVLHLNNLAFFASAIYVLGPVFPRSMGMLAIFAALFLWIGAGRIRQRELVPRQIKRALRLDGAILLACFAPLQLDGPLVPAFLCVQAVVTAACCRRLFGLWPAVYTSGIVVAAMLHIVGQDYLQENMTQPWTLAHGFDFTWVTVLAVCTAVSGYLVAAILLGGRTTGPWEKNLCAILITLATLLFVVVCTQQSDRYHATYWWMGIALLWCLAAFRFPIAGLVAPALVLATTVKFLAWDTLGAGIDDTWAELTGPAANRAVLAGALLALLLLLAIPVVRRIPSALARKLNVPSLLKVLSLTAPVVITWTGTFEIIRIFTLEPLRDRFAQADLAMQVALSLFWSGSATLFLIIGLVRANQGLRIFAMVQLGIVVAKVLLMDLAYLETVYRVVSFVALGLLMLLTSLLYRRLASRVLVTPAR